MPAWRFRLPTTRVGRLMALMVLLLTAVFGGIGWLQTQSLALLNANVLYQSDNIVRNFFQLETESLRLGQLLHDVARKTQTEPDDALRERYEIFVSRISLVDPQRTRDLMPELEVQRRAMVQLRALVVHMDLLLGPDAPMQIEPARVRALLPEFDAIGPVVRDLSLQANQAVAETTTRRNESVRDQSRIAIGLTLFQFLLLGVFALVVIRQVRALEQRRSELERLALNLQEARAEAEQASRSKSAFLANMSHELRTPFNGLLGMMSLLDRSALTAQQREYLGIARQSGGHLLTILNDMLDFSKMESGRLELDTRPTDLRQMVGEVQALMAPQARDKGLQFEVDLAIDLDWVVQVDAQRVKQILFNLLGNAIKFTDAGQVRLQVDRCVTVRGRLATRFRISDTGIGMDDATRARLFQRFSQGDDSISRRFGGTGLGLDISRTLAEMMEGEISVVSQFGHGSEFTVVLPLQAPEADVVTAWAAGLPADGGAAMFPEALPARSASAGMAGRLTGPLCVLVADDHPVNRQFMQALLECLGHRVLLATNGEEAVAMVQQQACDLVLMDVHMPSMDGLAATRAIRRLPLPASRVLVVALTADAFAESRERARQVGMDGFLAKPVQLHEVERLLRGHFGARAVGERMVSPAQGRRRRVRTQAGEAARILDLPLIADTCVALSAAAYGGLLAGFLADESAALADLLAVLDQGGEAADCTMAAHRFRGAAASLGLRELAATVQEIEADAGTWTAASARLSAQRLREQFAAVRETATGLGWLSD